jgi:putative ABC transport system permease protein
VETSFRGSAQVNLSRPLSEALLQSSPHIVQGAIRKLDANETFFSAERDGSRYHFKEKMLGVTPSYADVFDFRMAEGVRDALADPEKVLIPESMAHKIFGDEPAAGRRLQTEDGGFTVGGVYRDFPKNSAIDNVVYKSIPQNENLTQWGSNLYVAYVLLDTPANSAFVAEHIKTYVHQHFGDEDFGELSGWIGGFDYRLTALPDMHFTTDATYDFAPKANRQVLLILFAIGLMIVVIAGINLTNFNTALTPRRIRSINTQKVLGGDDRVIRLSLLVEAVAVGVASWLAALGMVYLAQYTPVVALVDADIALRSHPLILAATGLLAGLYPAYYMTSFPPVMALKGSFGLSPRGRQLRHVLIGVQFIAAFALIIGSAFMYLQNHYMHHASPGYETDALIVADLNGTVNGSLDAFSSRMKSFSGIEEVTYAQALLSSQDIFMGWGRRYRDKGILFECLPVDPSFLRVMGIDVPEGRDFREEDAHTRHGVFIFNQLARDRYELDLNGKVDSTEIVGFIPDVKFASFRSAVAPMAFFVWGTETWGSQPRYAYIKAKAGSDLHAAMTHVRATLAAFDSDYPFEVRFFDEVLNRSYEKEQRLSALITLFSLITILISIVGVFGLVVFDSEYRRKEIGIRRVFGSTTGEILVMFNKGYVRILALCFVLAAPVAWYAVTRWLENFAYKTPMYWWVYAAAFAVVFVLTVATVTFQNWRAANMNPVESLKAN